MNISNQQSNIQIFKSVCSNAISSLSGGMFSYGIGLMLLHTTHSPLSFGLDILISPIVGLLFFIPIGNFVDIHNHKKILIFSYLIRIITLVILSLLINHCRGNYLLFLVSIFIIIDSIINNFRMTTYSASVHELVNKNGIPTLSSFTQACSAGSQILSPAFGAILYTIIGINGFILTELISTVVAFLILLTMKFFVITTNQRIKTKPNPLTNFKIGINYMKNRILIKDLITLGTIISFLYTAVIIGMPFIIINKLNLSNNVVSLLETGFSIGILTGSISANFLQNKGHFYIKLLVPLIITGLGTIILGIILMLSKTAIYVETLGMVAMVIISLSLAILNVSLDVRLQTTVPTHILGRVTSTLVATNQVAMPLGILIFTALFKIVNNGSLIFLIDGIIMICYIIFLMPKCMKDIRSDNYYIHKHNLN